MARSAMLIAEVRRSWPQRLAMTSVFAANGLAFGAWVGNSPRLREEAGLDDASLGIVLLCGSIGSLLALQVVGRFARRIGTARVSWIRYCAAAVTGEIGLVLGC